MGTTLTFEALNGLRARWEYGISIDWIGRLVQEVSGQSLGAYMKANIFAAGSMAPPRTTCASSG